MQLLSRSACSKYKNGLKKKKKKEIKEEREIEKSQEVKALLWKGIGTIYAHFGEQLIMRSCKNILF